MAPRSPSRGSEHFRATPHPPPAKHLSTGLHALWADQPGPPSKALPLSPVVLPLPKALTPNLCILPSVAARCSPPHSASAHQHPALMGYPGPQGRSGLPCFPSCPARVNGRQLGGSLHRPCRARPSNQPCWSWQRASCPPRCVQVWFRQHVWELGSRLHSLPPPPRSLLPTSTGWTTQQPSLLTRDALTLSPSRPCPWARRSTLLGRDSDLSASFWRLRGRPECSLKGDSGGRELLREMGDGRWVEDARVEVGGPQGWVSRIQSPGPGTATCW